MDRGWMNDGVCRLCASTRLEPRFRVAGHALDRCRACRFVQVRDRPADEELQAIYGEGFFHGAKYDDGYSQRKENSRRLELLDRAGLSRGARVLDVGCATGDFIGAAADSFDMWGLDVSSFATEEARRKNPRFAGQIVTGFVEDARFERDFFDAIVMWDVVEHVWDPVAVCKRLVEHLRPGGLLVISTPDIGAPTARVMGKRWAFMTPPQHLGFFDGASMARLLEGHLGLRIVSTGSRGKWVNVG